jgi:hypothetical protein
MTTELKGTIAEHAAGNYRVMMNFADELLAGAAERDAPRLDEKLYFDVFLWRSEKLQVPRKREECLDLECGLGRLGGRAEHREQPITHVSLRSNGKNS